MIIEWTDKELEAIAELSKTQEMSEQAVVRQALRLYQAVVHNLYILQPNRQLPMMAPESQ